MAGTEQTGWTEETVDGFIAYVQGCYHMTLPRDVALRMIEGLNKNQFTVDDIVAANLLYQSWGELIAAFIEDLNTLWKEVSEALAPAFEQLITTLHEYGILLQRAEFYERLPSCWPEGLRDWLAAHWPERWLPPVEAERDHIIHFPFIRKKE